MAANAITFNMQLHAAKYNGACHLLPRWYVITYWAALACYSSMVQPRVAWHWGSSGPCLAKAIGGITGTCHAAMSNCSMEVDEYGPSNALPLWESCLWLCARFARP